MAKHKITDQQQRRIRRKQSSSIDSAGKRQRGENLLQSGELGPEQAGLVSTRYSNQVDIVTSPTSEPQRCYLRSNLESVVTGDNVIWRPGKPYGVVCAIQPRKTQLDRPDSRGKLRPVAANIDLIVVVIAPEPRPHASLIDRYLIAIEHRGIKPLLVFNKIDIASENTQLTKDFAHIYARLGYEVIEVSAQSGQGIERLTATLQQHTSVFVGQSGVGKSSLINAICPAAEAAIGSLSQAHTKGRHTTTTANLFFLPAGGQLIDSPGIREFGLIHLKEHDIAQGFIEFKPFLGHCKFRDCRHQNDPGCALQDALEAGKISPQRMQSYQLIKQSLANAQ
ncbi:MAG: small ribosomal subunit biogenesis GTPase RsgA [Gammaproteobacteria bacterium]|nr:small ribosomal subunit biogenesis GTPase RsgA [Gammaproteobacteria bacterium]MBQ0838406.1 small ribosomal subunit biogenesis GTPase RsgA [Gammaproteobacteria bacterium]